MTTTESAGFFFLQITNLLYTIMVFENNVPLTFTGIGFLKLNVYLRHLL
jgi:predicted small integral membrane protein